MTNLEDALVAVDAGADAVGFVFYEKSPRCVTLERAREIVEKLPESVETVGVFAGDSLMHAGETGENAGFDSLQLYPLATPNSLEVLEKAGLKHPAQRKTGQKKIYLALPVSKSFMEEHGLSVELADPEGEFVALLLDSGSGQKPGGTGLAFDWNSAATTVATLNVKQKVVVAGGLTPQNVGDAISTLQPWGVDVVSGVEASPGKKDREKVRAFVRAVREMDRRAG